MLQELLQYWRTSYDWRKQEGLLNQSFHHFRIPLNTIDVHFIHETSQHKHAIPLLLIHGWPGSFLEFTEIIPQLVNPGDSYTFAPPALPAILAPSCSCLKPNFSEPVTRTPFEPEAILVTWLTTLAYLLPTPISLLAPVVCL